MSLFRRFEKRSLPSPVNELPLWSAYTGLSSIPPHQALAIADVWACVRVLADSISSLPLKVYRTTSQGGRQEVTSGKLADLLTTPSPAMSQADLVSTMVVHLAVWGNAYLAKYRGPSGAIEQIGLLHPDRVRPELVDGEVQFRYSPAVGPAQILTTSDCVHIRGLSVDGIYGLSAVSQAGRVLGLSDHLLTHALSYFEGGGSLPTAVMKMAPDVNMGQDRERQKEQTKSDLTRRGVLVIEGDGDFSPISVSMDQLQFTEQRRLSAQEVARVFRIPSHLIGAPTGDPMRYTTSEQLSLEFVRYSLTPWLRRIELAISNDPDLAFAQQYVKFDVDALLRADASTRATVYHAALDPVQGWMTRAEVRVLEDLDPEEEPALPVGMPEPIANGNGASSTSNGAAAPLTQIQGAITDAQR